MIIEFTPLGAGQEIGRSCFVLTYKSDGEEISIMLDAGAHISNEIERFPDLSRLNGKKISALLLSHFHLDHAGAVPKLFEIYSDEVCIDSDTLLISTMPTKFMTSSILQEFTTGSSSAYLPVHIERALKRVRIIGLNETIEIFPGFFVTTKYSGHVLGGVMFKIQYKNSTIIYTGDYSLASDGLVGPAEYNTSDNFFDPPVDIVISESTYATTVRDCPKKRALKFCESIQEIVDSKGIVLIPAFSMGRAQELAMLIKQGVVLGKCKFYSSAVQSHKNFAFCELFKSWWAETCQHEKLPDLEIIDSIEDHVVDRPAIVFCAPSMLEGGKSLQFFEEIADDPNALVLLTGYCFKGTVGNKLILLHSNKAKNRKIQLPNKESLSVKCGIEYIPFTGHTDKVGIMELVRNFKPNHCILVHGMKDRMFKLAEELGKDGDIECHVPSNFETLKFEVQEEIEYDLADGNVLEDIIDDPERWKDDSIVVDVMKNGLVIS
jgi:integrator complex subunit 11